MIRPKKDLIASFVSKEGDFLLLPTLPVDEDLETELISSSIKSELPEKFNVFKKDQ